VTTGSFIVHLSPVWRERANLIVQADLAVFELPGKVEQFWVRQLGPFVFELCCIPFLTYGLALGDIIATDEKYVFSGLVERKGRLVIRISFSRGPKYVALREEVLAQVRQGDLLVEWYSEYYLSVDSPDDSSIRGLIALLEGLAEDQLLSFERGHLEPPSAETSG
jgi:hypothetical protein